MCSSYAMPNYNNYTCIKYICIVLCLHLVDIIEVEVWNIIEEPIQLIQTIILCLIGGSPDLDSVGSGTKRSSVSSGSRPRNRKEFLHKFLDSEGLTAKLEDWIELTSSKFALKNPSFWCSFWVDRPSKIWLCIGRDFVPTVV